MSGMGPMTERVVTSVLLALWRRPETTMAAVLRETLAPVPEVREALGVLRERRCLIEEEPGGALRLVSTGLACWRDVLEDMARREKLRVGRRVMVFFRTSSTNDVAWQCAVNPEMDGLVVVADEQTAGRGRLGHVWSAKAEQSVLMSVLLRGGARERGGVERNAEWLTMVTGLAVAAAVEEAAPGIEARIKWPNDVLIGGRKVAGILAERRGAANEEAVVVGIGINVMQGSGDFPGGIAERATSMYQATGRAVDRLRVAAAVVRKLDACVSGGGAGAGQGRGEESWIREWKDRCGMIGMRITARSAAEGGGVLSGEVVDVDPLEGLVVRDAAGAVHFLSAQRTTLSEDEPRKGR
ncbi:MAG TPA: biotin--[acetyl-CoA-carboxylase] ligase [Phycisphaerae bacterium]|nr:biotin--[acetyl-CoA-carboxylase] ligase [Phycisphaerae bacterium]